MQLQLVTTAQFDNTIGRKNKLKEITTNQEHIKMMGQQLPHKLLLEIFKCRNLSVSNFSFGLERSFVLNKEILAILHRIQLTIFMKDSMQTMKR